MTDPPDTDELMLRDIEQKIKDARSAFDREDWNDAAMLLGGVLLTTRDLIAYLRPRLPET